MVALFAAAAMGKPRIAAEPLGSAKEYYLVRDIDAEPGIVPATGLADRRRQFPSGGTVGPV
jgi:hypothetical protein